MKELPSIIALTESFAKLPGVGVKTAERMAYAVLNMDDDDRVLFSSSIEAVGRRVHRCPVCGLYTEDDKCEICTNESRDRSVIAVIAEPKDAYVIEKMQTYNGLYHVLGGLINASRGIGPDDIAIDSLADRVRNGNIKEVIIATSATIEGQTTALFIAKILEPLNVSVTRLATGLPAGGSLDYADSLTLARAFEGRKAL